MQSLQAFILSREFSKHCYQSLIIADTKKTSRAGNGIVYWACGLKLQQHIKNKKMRRKINLLNIEQRMR